MIRWGVVGTGDISAKFVPDLKAEVGNAVTGVWGRTRSRADAFAAEHRIAFATDSRRDLFARVDVDVAYIATPVGTHREIALEALDAGKHVLIEKPMASSAAEVEEIFDRAAAVGRFAMEGMWMRFNPLHVELRDRISDGLLGDVHSVRASFGMPFHPRGSKTTPAQGGSILLDRGIYPVTLAHWFLGEPSELRAEGRFDDDTDVAGHVTLEYRGGRFAQLAWSGLEFLDQAATVNGSRGWVAIDPMFWAGSTAHVHAGSVERLFVTPELVNHPRQGNGYRPMIGAVNHAIQDGLTQHPWHSREHAVTVARTMDSILETMRARRGQSMR